MAKMRGNSDDSDVNSTSRSGIRNTIEQRINASGRLVLGFVLFFGAWLLAAYTVDVFAESQAISSLAAVAFWFGFVFAAFTLLLALVLAILNAISEVRR